MLTASIGAAVAGAVAYSTVAVAHDSTGSEGDRPSGVYQLSAPAPRSRTVDLCQDARPLGTRILT